jgi:hypothetical protein
MEKQVIGLVLDDPLSPSHSEAALWISNLSQEKKKSLSSLPVLSDGHMTPLALL